MLQLLWMAVDFFRRSAHENAQRTRVARWFQAKSTSCNPIREAPTLPARRGAPSRRSRISLDRFGSHGNADALLFLTTSEGLEREDVRLKKLLAERSWTRQSCVRRKPKLLSPAKRRRAVDDADPPSRYAHSMKPFRLCRFIGSTQWPITSMADVARHRCLRRQFGQPECA